MQDVVVYHNPDVMGYPASEVSSLSIVTNKKVGDVRGARVGLLTGEGSPRTFYLCGYFTIEKVESGVEEGVQGRLTGSKGRLLNPMPMLNKEDWLADFKRSQGNFAFGLQSITKQECVQGLESVASQAD